jgi:prevent-host-death family protein
MMLKTITTSDLRGGIGRILNEVGYGGVHYLVSKSGQPTVAIISVGDYRLLERAKRQQAPESLRATLTSLRERGGELDAQELAKLVEEARAEYYRVQSGGSDAHWGAPGHERAGQWPDPPGPAQ